MKPYYYARNTSSFPGGRGNSGYGRGWGNSGYGRGRGGGGSGNYPLPPSTTHSVPPSFPKNAADIVPPPPPPPSEELKQSICEQSYLGNRGYTIPKICLSEGEIKQLRKETTLTPKSTGPSFGPPGTQKENPPCPYYRENEKYMYLPRAYGVSRYGLPYETRLSFGRDVRDRLAFASDKPLRDYQNEIIGVFLEHVRKQYQEFEVEEGAVDNISTAPLVTENNSQNQTHLERVEYGGGGILEVPCGRGKCLGKGTPILMYDGSIKMVQDICVGDVLMGDDSTPRKVLSLARGREKMYKVESKKGDGYIVNESHILSLKYGTSINKKNVKNSVLDISVSDYLKLPKYYHGKGGPLYGYRVPVLFDKKEVEIDPYLFGYWLGDGSSKGSCITTQESTVIKYIVDCFKSRHKSLYLKYTGFQYDYRINSIEPNTFGKRNIFMDFLKNYNIINNTHIPQHYKCNDRKTQLELLAGIIDSDGHYHDNCYEITQKNEALVDDIIFIAKSLGFAAYKNKTIKTCKSVNFSGIYYRINICGNGLEEIPVKCQRKKAHKRMLLRDCLKYRIRVSPIGEDDYYGFEIDGNRRFVLGDFTVTHNTVMALKIISEIGRPALIFVNKGFLADQWLERIATYLPRASVGRIQADVFDIEGRDIVICMIQTIYDRDYTSKAVFRDFGITVIDEVHRIGSGEYSKAMFNITTPYVLGISATVDRKDGMEQALKLFIGDVLYSDKRQDGDAVQIRSVEYSDPRDDKYNEVEHDFRGNVKYATMMSKICEHRPRLDFLFRILVDLVEEYPEDVSEMGGCGIPPHKPTATLENYFLKPDGKKEEEKGAVECLVCHRLVCSSEFIQTSCSHSFCETCLDDLETPKCPLCKKRFTLRMNDTNEESSIAPLKPGGIGVVGAPRLTEYPGQNQIIVLAQYRSVLRELFKRIQSTGLTTVGYYVGGMKQEDLDISKTKQILLATYSMASEGLDVATLSTLVFATPRTDIKQSVGRILRQKHARNPIVVDVVDSHSTFKNQWSKRRAYYKQNGYAIYKITSDQYGVAGMKDVEKTWKQVFSPSSVAKGAAKVAVVGKKGEILAKRGSGEIACSDSDEDDSEAQRKLAFDGECMI